MGIEISILAGKDESETSIDTDGSVLHVITDAERKSFGITDSDLKEYVGVYKGKRPKDVYVCSPTPWGDLYKTYDWSEVQVQLKVKNYKIKEFSSTPTILATHEFHNDHDKEPSTYTANISQIITDTTSSTWESSNTITVSQMIKYGITFLGADGGGETTMSYERSWGESSTKSESIELGSGSSVEITLGPNESATAELSTSKGHLEVEVEYEASLIGQVAVNYDPPYDGHHSMPSILTRY
ncbi:ETX/MTX2 family pore-forming toxin [Bacillus sp. JCM 19041]|uniref:ETX/MTX2 family pore-forming toxin n=1 Tax=Bacillus sp. JCM 19041 TaxID=1460637 RepID=UPI0006D1CE46